MCQSPFTGNQSTWFKAKETIYFCPTSVSSMSFLTSLTMAVPSELDNSASRECSWTALSRRAGWPSLTTYMKFNFWNNNNKKRHNGVSKEKQKQFKIRSWGDFGFIIKIIRSSLLWNKYQWPARSSILASVTPKLVYVSWLLTAPRSLTLLGLPNNKPAL